MADAEFVDVRAARVLARYIVELSFSNGQTRVLDLEPKMWGPAFEPMLADYATFCALTVDAGSGTSVWPNGADWSPDGLYASSKPVVPGRTAG